MLRTRLLGGADVQFLGMSAPSGAREAHTSRQQTSGRMRHPGMRHALCRTLRICVES